MNWRMSGPEKVAFQTMTVSGRTYSATPAGVVNGVPLPAKIVTVPDFDGAVLQANGWVFIAPSGPTSARPMGKIGPYTIHRGAEFYDETLGILLKSDGKVWMNPASGAAV